MFLALFFTFALVSCSSFEFDNPNDPRNNKGIVYSSSSAEFSGGESSSSSSSDFSEQKSSSSSVDENGGSSSSSEESLGNELSSSSSSDLSEQENSSSSSFGICTAANNNETQYCSDGIMKYYDSVVDDDGNTYKTVVIGEQTWMAENLNYNADNSICYGGTQAYCNTYGRLYNWTTAMEICPSDWHLPTNEEWDKLFRYVDGTSGTDSPYESSTAGRYLKAISGWSDYNGESSNGEDKYGFAALPGGSGSGNAGTRGFWWSASEYNDNAYYRALGYHSEGAGYHNENKSSLLNVRCIKD